MRLVVEISKPRRRGEAADDDVVRVCDEVLALLREVYPAAAVSVRPPEPVPVAVLPTRDEFVARLAQLARERADAGDAGLGWAFTVRRADRGLDVAGGREALAAIDREALDRGLFVTRHSGLLLIFGFRRVPRQRVERRAVRRQQRGGA